MTTGSRSSTSSKGRRFTPSGRRSWTATTTPVSRRFPIPTRTRTPGTAERPERLGHFVGQRREGDGEGDVGEGEQDDLGGEALRAVLPRRGGLAALRAVEVVPVPDGEGARLDDMGPALGAADQGLLRIFALAAAGDREAGEPPEKKARTRAFRPS